MKPKFKREYVLGRGTPCDADPFDVRGPVKFVTILDRNGRYKRLRWPWPRHYFENVKVPDYELILRRVK